MFYSHLATVRTLTNQLIKHNIEKVDIFKILESRRSWPADILELYQGMFTGKYLDDLIYT